MTVDMHNDMDDLFRSGLEGKEDNPSPDVWAAIARNLPTPPPPATPAPSAPPAAGGWASSVIIKGIIGAAVVAIVGTAIFYMTSGKEDQVGPDVPTAETETTRVSPQPDMQVKTKSPLEETSTDGENAASPEDQSGTANPAGEEKAAGTTTLKDTLMSGPDNNPNPEKNTGRNEITHKANVTLPEALRPDKEKRTNRVKDQREVASMPNKGVDPVSRPTTDAEKSNIPTSGQNSGSALPIVRVKSATATSAGEVSQEVIAYGLAGETGRATATTSRAMDRTDRAAFRPAGISPGMRLNVPSLLITPQTTLAGSVQPPAVGGKGSATLKRNNWTSRIFVTPIISLNMTRMDVQENREYGPRVGREHIEFRETEETRTTLSPGLIAGFAISPSVSVQTGISELRNDISVSAKEIRAVRDRDGKVRYRLDCSSGSYFIEPKAGTSPSVGDSLRIASSDIRMRYASVPLSVRVNFGSEKVRLFAMSGADINILAGKQTSTSLSATSNEKVIPVRSEGTRKQYVTGTLGAGVEIKAGKRVGIMVMPQYRFPLGNMNEEGPVLTYPKTFSISSGLRIGF